MADRTELLKRSKRNSGRRRGRNSTEVRKDAVSLKTKTSERHSLGADRFSRFSSLHSLQRAIANLIIVVKEFKRRRNKDRRKIVDALIQMDQRKVKGYVTNHGCEWIWNPPHASHFGVAWERPIGTIRRVLDAMFAELGSHQLTHELLVTLMAEVIAVVNARPISALPTDVDEPQPLSPSMLLTMKTRPLGPPPGNFVPPDVYARRRWRRVQYLADQFWIRWRREYLQSMQTRTKWQGTRRNLRAGDVVLVREEGAYRNDWPIGRVSEAMESDDGRVRKAQVESKKGPSGDSKKLVLLVPAPAEKEK